MSRFIAVAITFASVVAAFGQSESGPRTIIEQAAAAHGGTEVLSKYAAGRTKVRGTYFLGGKETPYSGETLFQLPDRVRSTIELTIDGKPRPVVEIANGKKVAMVIGGLAQNVAESQAQEIRLSLYCQDLARLTPLLNGSKFTLAAAPEKTIDEKPAVGVRVSSAGHPDVTLYFDKSSHLLAMLERPGFDPKGGKVQQQEFYSNYGTAKGIKYPGKTRVVQNGKLILESNTADYEPLERVDSKEFTIPS